MSTKRRYMITYSGNSREMYPVNIGTQKYVQEVEQDQVFRRKKVAVPMQFSDDVPSGHMDFTFFKTIELAGDGCAEVLITIQRECGGIYVSEWDGYFSTGSGSFDFDRCIFTVTPEPDDDYRCILENWDKVFNMMLQVFVTELVQQDKIIYETINGDTVGLPSDCDGKLLVATDNDPSTEYAWNHDYLSAQDMIDKGWCVKTHSFSSTTCRYILYQVGDGHFQIGDVVQNEDGGTGVICYVDDDGTLANGDSTFMIICNVTGTWPETLGNVLSDNTHPLVTGHIIGISIELSEVTTVWESQLIDIACASGVCNNPLSYYLVSTHCNTDGYCTFRRCPAAFDSLPIRGYNYMDIISQIIPQLCSDFGDGGLTAANTSIFFDYNADADDPLYQAGINYMTGAANKVNFLFIAQESDVVRAAEIAATTADPATVGNLTLKQLLQWAREVFNVYWDVIRNDDGVKILRMEHWNYYNAINMSIDMRLDVYQPYVKKNNKYIHLKEQIPANEKFKWVDAIGVDFVGKDIIYSPLCSTSANDVSHTPENLSTDLAWIEDNLPLEGSSNFVMIACELVFPDYLINNEVGLISGENFPNAHLSWANLHQNYHRWNRYLQTGNMNGNDTVFLSWKPNIQQVVLQFPLCCTDIDPYGYVESTLGDILGKSGHIHKLEYDFTDLVTLTLTYSI